MIPPSVRRATAITVINLKGGVGKTHTTWLLAGACQEAGKRVLLVDLDTQSNLTNSFRQPGSDWLTVERVFDPASDASLSELIQHSAFSHIDVVPAGPRLTRFDETDRHRWEQSDTHLSLIEPLANVRADSDYNYVIFDCPPRLSVVSYAALCASDYVIVPLEAADWGAQGIMQVTAAIQEVQRLYNPRLKLLGYLVSRFKRARAYQQSYLKQLRANFGALAFDSVIPDVARFEQSVTDRIPITLHAPRSKEADIARAFFREVERRIKVFGAGGPKRRTKNVPRAAAVAA